MQLPFLRRQRWLIWLTLWVVSLAALAPTVSRALWAPASAAGSWTEVCTEQGVRWVRASADNDGAERSDNIPGTGQTSIDRCVLCVLMGDRLAPPVQLALELRASVVLPTPYPARLSLAPPPAPPFLRPPSRGPPSERLFLMA